MKSIIKQPSIQVLAVLVIFSLMLCNCVAHAPVDESQAVEETLKSAFAAEASVYAPNEYARAQESFYLAKIEMDKLNYRKAQDLLEESRKEAQLAIYKAQAGKAIKLAKEQLDESDLVKLEKYITDVSSIAQRSLKKAESAFESKKYNLARQKAELSLQLSKELPRLLEKKISEERRKSPEGKEKEKVSEQAKKIVEEAKREAAAIIAEAKKEARAVKAHLLEERFPSSYKVRKGDTLRIIAGRREIYNDPYQWLLIYKSNRDQIRDPLQIFIGQNLVIPRNVTLEEVKEARKQAGVPPPYDPPPEAFHPSDYQ